MKTFQSTTNRVLTQYDNMIMKILVRFNTILLILLIPNNQCDGLYHESSGNSDDPGIWAREKLEDLEIEKATANIIEFCTQRWGQDNPYSPAKEFEVKLISNDSSEIHLPIDAPHFLFRNPYFHLVGNVTIFFTGWECSNSLPMRNVINPIDLLHKAYKCRGTHNFLVIDTGRNLTTFIEMGQYDYQSVARQLSKDILPLLHRIGIQRVHLIGHGVGAHVAGILGRYYLKRFGKALPRITGLDPANICLQEHILRFGLQRGDAEFVDVIHSSHDTLGLSCPVGDADFYISRDLVEASCSNVVCSHFRSVDYFASTIPFKLAARMFACRPKIIHGVQSDECWGEKVQFGLNADVFGKGNFIVKGIPPSLNLVDLRDCYEN